MVALVGAVAWLLVSPVDAFAWGPATHIAIGEAVLASLHLLPPAIQVALRQHRSSFLYGSVAADISFAKKYAAVGRHSHHWHMGEEILEAADSDALRAVALGYLSHLAADTIAHNFYVPRRLVLTRTTHTVGHTYWEYRMDVLLGKRFGTVARDVVLVHDHASADELFDRVLSRTLFSFRTNRRLFRGMIAFQDYERWQKVFDEILRRSRFDLPDRTRDLYLRLAYDYVMDFLAESGGGRARALDPIGENNLQLAKTVRRQAFVPGGSGESPELVRELADQFFPLPDEPLVYAPRAPEIEVPGLGGVSPPRDGEPGDEPPRRGRPSLAKPSSPGP